MLSWGKRSSSSRSSSSNSSFCWECAWRIKIGKSKILHLRFGGLDFVVLYDDKASLALCLCLIFTFCVTHMIIIIIMFYYCISINVCPLTASITALVNFKTHCLRHRHSWHSSEWTIFCSKAHRMDQIRGDGLFRISPKVFAIIGVIYIFFMVH